jgi:hypothetical protein
MIQNQTFFLFDCQTTGTQPAHSYVIEAAWGCYRASDQLESWQCRWGLVALPEAVGLSRKVQQLTGLPERPGADDGPLFEYPELCSAVFDDWLAAGQPPFLIHYAQFERAFLKLMAAQAECEAFAEAPIICTHRLAKQVFGGLRSYSLRACAGYLGFSLAEHKRATHHLRATAAIWQAMASQLQAYQPPAEPEQVATWLRSFKGTKRVASPTERVASDKRLQLPTGPGIYRFKDRQGRILYVGKAINLKARVNSYFRGRLSKGSRLNEMLTRMDDFEVTTLRSPLEALLRENDEIKKWDPPYNRQLRIGQRSLTCLRPADVWADHQRSEASGWSRGILGPLPTAYADIWSGLWELLNGHEREGTGPWGMPWERDLIVAAVERLFANYGLAGQSVAQPAAWASFMAELWRERFAELVQRNHDKRQQHELSSLATAENDEADDLEDEADTTGEEAWEWTVETVAYVWQKWFAEVCRRVYRGKWAARLNQSALVWREQQVAGGKSWSRLVVDGSRYELEVFTRKPKMPVMTSNRVAVSEVLPELIDLCLYDRLAIIYREIRQAALAGRRLQLAWRPEWVLDQDDLLNYLV